VLKLCQCSRAMLDINHASYAVDGVPCCSNVCFNQALTAQGRRERGRAARNVPIGTSWAFHDHRTMEQVMRDEGASDAIA